MAQNSFKRLNSKGIPFLLEIPDWEPVPDPVRRVRIATDTSPPVQSTITIHATTMDIPLRPKNTTIIPTAGGNVSLRPKVQSPYHTLTVGDITMDSANVWFGERCQKDLNLEETAPAQIEEKSQKYRDHMAELAKRMTEWRTKRRQWELQLMESLWVDGKLTMFKPDFGIDDIVSPSTCRWAKELDAEGMISMRELAS